MLDNLNIGQLAQPITELIGFSCNGIGRVYNDFIGFPKSVKNMKITGDLEVSFADGKYTLNKPLEQLTFVEKQEAIKFKNQLEIVEGALKKIEEDILNSKNTEYNSPDPDWTTIFLENSKYISEEQLKDLWSSLLKNALTSKETTYKRTLEIMKNLSIEDIEFLKAIKPFICTQIVPFYKHSKIQSDYYKNVILNEDNQNKSDESCDFVKAENSFFIDELDIIINLIYDRTKLDLNMFLQLSNMGLFSLSTCQIDMKTPRFFTTNDEIFFCSENLLLSAYYITNECLEIFNLLGDSIPYPEYTNYCIEDVGMKQIPENELKNFIIENKLYIEVQS